MRQLKAQVEIEDIPSNSDYRFAAVLGDLAHKRFVYEHFNSASSAVVLELIKVTSRARYIEERESHLVPGDIGNKDPPSVTTLARIFEHHFECDVQFKYRYHVYVRGL